MPNPFVATSLDVIPPLAIRNRGRQFRFRTNETRERDTTFPMARLSAGVVPVTSVRLVYATAFPPEAMAFRTRSSTEFRIRSRRPSSSPTRSATSISIFTRSSNASSAPSCAVVLGTYDPTTIRPPRCRTAASSCSPLTIVPASNIGRLGSPIRACTNDAADRTSILFPSLSSASIRASATTSASRRVTALTTHGRMFDNLDSLAHTASGPPVRISSMEMLSMLSRPYRPFVFSTT
mmetsp:Transcript_27396/g.65861  ORF Transcript_27396/g.65861 Transcript_27396/m.65861 type:complete len:236 (-) Transcript_27396:749-1456(-)